MLRPLPFLLAAGLVAAAALLPARPLLAHGEPNEAQLAEFQNHLDDYRDDVQSLVAQTDAIVEAHRSGAETAPKIAALIEQWEDVGVHAAIETKATVTYPGIWQALISLQQAVDAGKPPAAVAEAGSNIEAALWQGYGAVRLAASQVGTGSDTAQAPADASVSGPQTVAQIIADLDQAVAAYRNDELQRAEALIHETYMSRFEGLEGELIEHDPDLVSQLEKDFNATLPLLMQQGAPLAQVREQLDAMKAQLETASRILEQAEQSRSEVF